MFLPHEVSVLILSQIGGQGIDGCCFGLGLMMGGSVPLHVEKYSSVWIFTGSRCGYVCISLLG